MNTTESGVLHLKRLTNSVNGNPRFSVTIGNTKGTTPTDSNWVYAICDSWNGKNAVATFSGKKCIDLHLQAS